MMLDALGPQGVSCFAMAILLEKAKALCAALHIASLSSAWHPLSMPTRCANRLCRLAPHFPSAGALEFRLLIRSHRASISAISLSVKLNCASFDSACCATLSVAIS